MNPVGEWSTTLVDAFVRSSVQDVVVSPGSRSTPLVEAFARHPEIHITDVMDERAAGFFALGRAKARDVPVVLVCTSGTAAAHYYPALIEASLSYVPLLVLSADRPLSLQGCGANQTVDQVKLFGDHVRLYAEIEPPSLDASRLRALRRLAVRAVHTARHPLPGPVHLDCRFEKPLESRPAATDEERAGERLAEAVRREPLTTVRMPRVGPNPLDIAELAARITGARCGVVVAGPAPIRAGRDREVVREVCERAGLALWAEATSQLRFAGPLADVGRLDGFDAVLRGGFDEVDLVVQLGAYPVSGAFDRWLRERPALDRVVLAETGWPDPVGTARQVVAGPIAETLRALHDRLEGGPAGRGTWARSVGRLGAEVVEATDRVLVRTEHLSEAFVARATVASLPRGGLLSVGNSLPIRVVDRWVHAPTAELSVLSQRGASGIDGLVSSTAGAASALGAPAALLIGDVSFLHDLTGLALAARCKTPLAIVVVNNDGGRLFEQLPVAETVTEEALAHWTTPHGRSLEGAARLWDLDYVRASTPDALEAALATVFQPSPHTTNTRATVIEAVVPPHRAAADDRALDHEVTQALSAWRQSRSEARS